MKTQLCCLSQITNCNPVQIKLIVCWQRTVAQTVPFIETFCYIMNHSVLLRLF